MDTSTTMDHAQNVLYPLTTCYSLNKSLLHLNLCSSAQAKLSIVSHGVALLFTRPMPTAQKLVISSKLATKKLSIVELVLMIVNSWTREQFSLLNLALKDTFSLLSKVPLMSMNVHFAAVWLRIHFTARKMNKLDITHMCAQLERKLELLTLILTISKLILKTISIKTVLMMLKLVLTIPITGVNLTKQTARLWLLWFKQDKISLLDSAHLASKIATFQLKTDSSRRISSPLRILFLV